MKKAFLLTFSLVMVCLFAQAQCDYPNGDLENWQTFPFEIAGETRDIETPADHISYNRFFINYFYAEFFGDPVATDLFLNNTQLFWGIEKSTDASTGQYAVKLIAEPNLPFADLYANYACTETHDVLKVDVKHVGNTSDTLIINGAYDANLPPLPIGDQAGLDTLAAYYYGYLILDDTSDYITLSLPLQIGDANAPIDSFSLNFFSTALQGSYFLIDNIRFESAPVDEDNDGFTADVDCDDTNPDVNPGATEVCNTIDDNCDGDIDEGVTTTFYADADGDGFGDANSTADACDAPAGYVDNDGDCDDTNDAIHPDATEVCNGVDDNCDGDIDEGVSNTFYADADGDGFGDANSTADACDVPAGYVDNDDDCDDTNDAIHPDATEVCNGVDDNCDGDIDEGVSNTFYADADGDGFGDANSTADACDAPAGYADNDGDCDDANDAVNPGATEICNGVDDNCDGDIDEGVSNTYYADADLDGYGDPATTVDACDAPDGYVDNADDCDDANADVNPDATEICNGIDDNCDGGIDEGLAVTYYLDADNDGYGDLANALDACDLPDGYVDNSDDCDDANSFVNPAVDEVCNGIDDNCDGNIDEGLTSTFYADADGDGFGDPDNSVEACDAPADFVTNADDCNDADADEYPDQTWFLDVDGDGYGNGTFVVACERPDNGYLYTELIDTDLDCDDDNAAVNPDALEYCDNIDNNCNGDVDDNVVYLDYYLDADGDGYGAGPALNECFPPGIDYVTNADDCDDDNLAVNPGAAEVCNGADDNCDGNIDEGVTSTFYADADNDGYGDAATSVDACDAPDGYVSDDTDCDDTNDAVNPGATEICNGADENCDGAIDEGVTKTFYADADNDGYGVTAISLDACAAPDGYVVESGDCDDANDVVNPGATEICNGVDDNCDGAADEGLVATYYLDADGDGYGDAAVSVDTCAAPAGYVANGNDCDDANDALNPGVTEVCNGVDDNCDGQADEGLLFTYYLDADGDGFGDANMITVACSAPADYVPNADDCDDTNAAVNPGAIEVCNTIDDNCDGDINEDLLDNYYLDADGDGFGDIVSSILACEAPADYVDNADDCDDTNAAVHPGATEVCNTIDDNCNGQTDEGVTSTFYLDDDGDGFGVANMTTQACDAPAGYAANDDDCNDASAAVNPGATEVCNGADDNCNGQTDEGVTSTFYLDDDGDGFGDAAASVQDCAAPDDYVSDNTDCDDDDDAIYPGATEVANNGIDEDCDGEDFISSTDELAELGIKVYPNPFSDRIRLENVPANGYEVKLLNIFGQTMPILTGNNVELQCSNLPAGTYFVQITEQDTARRKVVRVVKQ